jgi:hypothetical protein
MSFVKAKLELENGGEIKFAFNPTEISISRANSVEAKKTTGKAMGKVEFKGGDPQELSLEMFLDDLGSGDGVDGQLDALHGAMEVAIEEKKGKTNSGRPQKVTFAWGAIKFKGLIKSLGITHARFSAAGATTRATVKIAITQTDPRPKSSAPASVGQNPTTRALPDLGAHILREGDTLQAVATDIYGDPNHWRELAAANGIDDPLRLRRGTVLALPEID